MERKAWAVFFPFQSYPYFPMAKNKLALANLYGLAHTSNIYMGFPGGSDNEESVCNAGDPRLIPGLGRSPGEGSGNPLQYSCLENSIDSRAWRATVHGAINSQT